ncbi:hypothetical protein ACS0TY_004525 [Phlomoides rotata]
MESRMHASTSAEVQKKKILSKREINHPIKPIIFQPYSTGNNHPAAALMARNNKKVGKSNWEWTNERHVHFLNSMEASFVQSMFQKNNSHVPPLDRYIPDSSESTQDLAKQRRTTSGNQIIFQFN